MKAHVITIWNHERSGMSADWTIATGRVNGTEVSRWWATTPRDDPFRHFNVRDWVLDGFLNNGFSRLEPCLATFLSHAALWEECIKTGQPVLILEHDAHFIAPLPAIPETVVACNLGRPSFGTFKHPPDGFGPLQSKPDPHYLGGAHAYYVTPFAASQFLEKARREAGPTDVFLNRKRFPWFAEYHPWPIVCEDSFTTIQKPAGCAAKHNKVEIVEP